VYHAADSSYFRRLARRLAVALGGVKGVQKAIICFIPLATEVEIALCASLLTADEAWPRALLIAAFAALSHILMNGFFILLPSLLRFNAACTLSSSGGGAYRTQL
jgi:hypothetical protein